MIKENSNKIISKKLTAFDFFGPTCDSMDYMKGPFLLPNNIKENDYIELGQLGAYGLTFTIVDPLSATKALPGSQIIFGNFSSFKFSRLFLISLK